MMDNLDKYLIQGQLLFLSDTFEILLNTLEYSIKHGFRISWSSELTKVAFGKPKGWAMLPRMSTEPNDV